MERQQSQLAGTIRERRTIRDFNGEPVDKAEIVDILNDAVWAPFHSRKEPWRFILFMGAGRHKFAEAVIRTYDAETRRKWGDWAREQYGRLMQAHLIVVVEADPRQKYGEEAFSAGAALIQNVQLLAWEKGIGAVWKTNLFIWDPSFHREVGVEPGERIVGVVHLGRFDKTPRPKPRTPVERLLVCVEE